MASPLRSIPASVAATRYRFSLVRCWVHAARRLLELKRKTAAVTGLVTTTSYSWLGCPGSKTARSILWLLVGSTLLKIPVISTRTECAQLRIISARHATNLLWVLLVRLPSSRHFWVWTPRASTSWSQAQVVWANNGGCGMSNRFRKVVRNSDGNMVKASVWTVSSYARASRLFTLW